MISYDHLLIYGGRPRLPPAGAKSALGIIGWAAYHSSLLPEYSSLHSDSKSLKADKLPLLFKEIAIHQQELQEGRLQVILSTFRISRQQQTGRREVPSHRGGPLAPPSDAAPQYAAQHTGSNGIGARGCEYLQ
jgi:hypothetical protein